MNKWNVNKVFRLGLRNSEEYRSRGTPKTAAVRRFQKECMLPTTQAGGGDGEGAGIDGGPGANRDYLPTGAADPGRFVNGILYRYDVL